MLKMPQQEYIKFLREAEGLSVSDIARQVGVHWRTAKRYADQSDWNKRLGKRKSSSPVMGVHGDCRCLASSTAWKAVVDSLETDNIKTVVTDAINS
jgi:hypothetical protein